LEKTPANEGGPRPQGSRFLVAFSHGELR
jgi:hypothetical protein